MGSRSRGRSRLERFEVASARRRRLQRAVRRAVDAPSDRDGLPVQEGLPVAVAHRGLRHLLKPDARGVAARMDPPPARREGRCVRGHGAASGTDSNGRHHGGPTNVGHLPGRNRPFVHRHHLRHRLVRPAADRTSSPYALPRRSTRRPSRRSRWQGCRRCGDPRILRAAVRALSHRAGDAPSPTPDLQPPWAHQGQYKNMGLPATWRILGR
jgi:hypothetical protein